MLKDKIVLGDKGQEANVVIKQALVKLSWNAGVDLDLMAFYKTKTGEEGAVFTKLLGGSQGDMNAFPFIQLSEDAGVGAVAGSNIEELRIMKLDDMAEVNIVALNYTDAKSGSSKTFSNYDGKINIIQDNGEQFEVPLTSTQSGVAAVICKIDNSSMIGAKLINVNEVVDLPTLVNTIPGATKLIN